MAPNCPWQFLRQDNLRFCEEVICFWLKQPSNTVSNIGFLIVGWLIWKLARKEGRPHLRWLGAVCAFTGIGSAFYHASGTYLGGILDYTGMFAATGLMTGLNLRRWLGSDWPTVFEVSAFTSFALILSMIIWPDSERMIFIFADPCCLLELRLFFRDGHRIDYTYYRYFWEIMIVGALVWWLDDSRFLCVPGNHILTGHAVWHLLMAGSYFVMYRYYSQFEVLSKEESAPAVSAFDEVPATLAQAPPGRQGAQSE